LKRVSYPTTRDAFGPIRKRIEAYGFEPDDDDYIEEGEEEDGAPVPEEEEDDEEWIRRDCEEWAKSFLLNRDQQHLADILHTLKTENRKSLLRCLISTALYEGDVAAARLVGSLYTVPTICELCCGGDLFIQAIQDELMMLQDILLDLPNASQLMAHVLHSTTLGLPRLEALVNQPESSSVDTVQHLIRTLQHLELQRGTTDDRCEEERVNRFERTSSRGSQSTSGTSFVH